MPEGWLTVFTVFQARRFTVVVTVGQLQLVTAGYSLVTAGYSGLQPWLQCWLQLITVKCKPLGLEQGYSGYSGYSHPSDVYVI